MPLHNACFLASVENGAMLAGTHGIKSNDVLQTLQILGKGSKFPLEAFELFFKWSPVFKADRCHSFAPNRGVHGKKRTHNPMLLRVCVPSTAHPCESTREFERHSCVTAA